MILQKFKASKVHKVYDFDITFNEDLTFITGINGTGKTTVLKIIESCFDLDLEYLERIEFQDIEIIFLDDSGDKIIYKVSKEDGVIELKLTTGEHDETICCDLREEDFFEKNGKKRLSLSKNKLWDVVERVSPIFIGVNRNLYDSEICENNQKQLFFHSMINKKYNNKSKGDFLLQCMGLIKREFKIYKNASQIDNNKIVQNVIEAACSYRGLESSLNISDWKANQDILKMAKGIEKIYKDVGGKTNNPSIFFSRLENDFKNANNDNVNIEFLLNFGQINIIQNIIKEIKNQEEKSVKAYESIGEFITTINKFFHMSDKKVEIDILGDIKIIRTKSRQFIPLEALSSGEKQLFILLTFSRFRNGKKVPKVFVVDEPEISLHIEWQDMLVDSLQESSRFNQFILATHSPDLIGEKSDKIFSLNKKV